VAESKREIADRIERETRFYTTSLTLQANQVTALVRDHRAVENSLHWVLDMAMRLKRKVAAWDDDVLASTGKLPVHPIPLPPSSSRVCAVRFA
jgi:hypothetical protein